MHGNTSERAEEHMDTELIQWIRDDRPRLAVLESQVKELKEAHKEYIKELREFREQFKGLISEALEERDKRLMLQLANDVTKVVAECRKSQDEKKKEGDKDKSEKAGDVNSIAAIWKYIGAAVGGAGIAFLAFLEWLKNGSPLK